MRFCIIQPINLNIRWDLLEPIVIYYDLINLDRGKTIEMYKKVGFIICGACLLLQACTFEEPRAKVERLLKEGNTQQAYSLCLESIDSESYPNKKLNKIHNFAYLFKAANQEKKARFLFELGYKTAEKYIEDYPQDKNLQSTAQMVSLNCRQELKRLKEKHDPQKEAPN